MIILHWQASSSGTPAEGSQAAIGSTIKPPGQPVDPSKGETASTPKPGLSFAAAADQAATASDAEAADKAASPSIAEAAGKAASSAGAEAPSGEAERGGQAEADADAAAAVAKAEQEAKQRQQQEATAKAKAEVTCPSVTYPAIEVVADQMLLTAEHELPCHLVCGLL